MMELKHPYSFKGVCMLGRDALKSSYKGRISRGEYNVANAILSAGLGILASVLLMLTGFAEGVPVLVYILLGLLVVTYIVAIVFGFRIYVMRFHDMNHSGWWALTILIPIVNIIPIIMLVFVKGTNDENAYGANPLDHQDSRNGIYWGVCLVVVLISFIIGMVLGTVVGDAGGSMVYDIGL